MNWLAFDLFYFQLFEIRLSTFKCWITCSMYKLAFDLFYSQMFKIRFLLLRVSQRHPITMDLAGEKSLQDSVKELLERAKAEGKLKEGMI